MNAAEKQAFEQVLTILKDGQPVAFSHYIAKTVNNPKVAIFLSQLVYWARTSTRISETAGFIYKTYKEWNEETGLSRHEMDTVRNRARTMHLIEELRTGRPATLWYRLNLAQLNQALDVCRKEPLEIDLTFAFMQAEPQIMRAVIGPTTAYHTMLSDLTGSVTSGLLLSRLLQLQKRAMDGNRDWVTVTGQMWCNELGMNRRTLDTARERLRALHLIEEVDFHNGTRRILTRVRSEILLGLLQAHGALAPLVAAKRMVQGTRRMAPVAIPTSMPIVIPSTIAALAEPGSGTDAVGKPASRPTSVDKSIQDCRFRTVQNAGFVHTTNIEYDYTYDHNSRTRKGHGRRDSAVVVGKQTPNPQNRTSTSTLGQQGVLGGSEGVKNASEQRIARFQDGDGYRPTYSLEKSLKTPVFAFDEHASGIPVRLDDAVDDGLTWPAVIAPALQEGARRMLAALSGQSLKQSVLDELVARARAHPIRNLLGYLRQLILTAKQGVFVPEVAHQEAQRRQVQAAVAASRAAALALDEPAMPVAPPVDRDQARANLAQLKAMLATGAGSKSR